jgi:subtilisin family serine protease
MPTHRPEHAHKLDPRLRRLAKRMAAKPKGKRESAQVFVELANAEAAAWVESQAWIRDLVRVVDGYYTASIPADRFEELAAHDGVIEVEGVRYLRPHLDRSVESIHGHDVPAGASAVPDGQGVVIGFVDYGLDFKQKDFQNPADGTTRIAYLWDQHLKRKGKERVPAKYGYGVEYSGKNIDAAVRKHKAKLIRHDPLAAKDIAGHGTHVAGIAAGNGDSADAKFPPGKYIGVAPAATIVFVSLDRKKIIEQVGAQRGTLANSLNIAHGIAYCFEKAEELGMPCVVNLSLGANGGGHDGNMALEWIIDALLQKSGRAVVLAAGNEDDTARAVHATGTLGQGETFELEWDIGYQGKNDPDANELELWYERGSSIGVSLVAPDAEASPEVVPAETGEFTFKHGEKVSVYSDPFTPWHGAARIHVGLGGAKKKGIRCGKWILKLRALDVAPAGGNGRARFDAWIERTLPAGGKPQQDSRFARYDPRTAINVTTPGTARRAITVGGYANDGSSSPPLYAYSGRGPTRDAREKPDLAAPGDPVMSTDARAGTLDEDGNLRPARIPFSGTSMSAPHVSGVVARMLSCNAFLTAEEIRDALVKSATPPRGVAGWDAKWGAGRLDAARAVELVERLTGVHRPGGRGPGSP